jgi:hypothetical protein
MAGPAGRARIPLRSIGGQVVLSSPHPVSECVQRLARVTTDRRAADWYLHQWTLGRPDPRFRGEVDLSRAYLFRFSRGRGRAVAVLDARPATTPDGGATLSGWVGEDKGNAVILPLIGSVFGLPLLVAGMAQLAAGHLIGLALAGVAPSWRRRVCGPQGGELAPEWSTLSPSFWKAFNEVLGSAAAFTGPSAGGSRGRVDDPAADAHGDPGHQPA